MDLVNRIDQPVYQHPNMAMMRQSNTSSVPGSIPINFHMGNSAQRNMGMQGTPPMSGKRVGFAQQEMTAEQQHPQQFLHAEENNVANLPSKSEENNVSNPSFKSEENDSNQLPSDENEDEMSEDSQEGEVDEKKEESRKFKEAAHPLFVKISKKEMKIRAAAEELGRPYSFVYARYQEFRDYMNGVPDKKEKKKAERAAEPTENGTKKRKRKKLTLARRSRKKFQCEDCPAIFHTKYLFDQHAKVHLENNESHLCTSCGIVFPKLGHLMKHRIETHEDALQCPHCEKQYTKVSSYKFHIATHSDVRPFVCEECGKGFFSKCALEDHYRKHTGEKPFMCGYCEKTFIAINNLNKHQKVHLKDPNTPRKKRTVKPPKKLPCVECGRIFKTEHRLSQHMNTHTGNKPYACDLCDARFALKGYLFRHKQIHTGEKPFKCNYCPAAFLRKIDLQVHDMAHTGIKPYKCSMCDYSTTKKLSLEYHMNAHTGKTPFKCDFYGCNAEFANPVTLKTHKAKHVPPPPRTCEVCKDKFPDLHTLKRHMVIHPGYDPLPCTQCDKVFYETSQLNRHMHVHMYRPNRDKPKQVKQKRKNTGIKKEKAVANQKKFSSELQVPGAPGHNGNSSVSQTWTTNAEGIQNSQPGQSFGHAFPANPYTNLNAWPQTVDPDELRHRLLSSFKY